MHQCDNLQPDTVIISMLEKNNDAAWSYIYEKYAAMMYGIVFNMTNNEIIAGAILTEVFAELKAKKLLSRVKSALCHSLVRHTHKLTIKYLNARGLSPISQPSVSGDYPLLNALYFELTAINETTSNSGTEKQQILINLREEFNRFRNQNK